MSYCRWSSDNWRSDVYCYGDIGGGYTTHVAGNRVIGEIPQEPSWDLLETPGGSAAFAAQHRVVMDFLRNCQRAPIGLAHDGATFNDPDLESFLERLETLRAIGYHVPQFVFDELNEELAAQPSPEKGR